MVSFGSRLRNKLAGALASGDENVLGQKVATGWLRLVGVDVDAKTGIDRQTDWLRLRAEASLRHEQAAEAVDEPDAR